MADEKISEYFSFLTERGFAFERDYNKGTDKTCTQIYRFRRDAGNFLEFRVLSARERTVCVCANGEKRFPDLGRRYRKFIRKWNLRRLFSKTRKDGWLLVADLLRYVLETEGSLFGIEV